MTIELNSSCFDLHLSKETKTERKQTTTRKKQTIRQMFAQYRKQCMLLEPGEC